MVGERNSFNSEKAISGSWSKFHSGRFTRTGQRNECDSPAETKMVNLWISSGCNASKKKRGFIFFSYSNITLRSSLDRSLTDRSDQLGSQTTQSRQPAVWSREIWIVWVRLRSLSKWLAVPNRADRADEDVIPRASGHPAMYIWRALGFGFQTLNLS